MRANAATLEEKCARIQSQHKETEKRGTQLQARATKLIAREKELITNHEKDIQKASDLNKKLRHQLEEKFQEAAENAKKFKHEVMYCNALGWLLKYYGLLKQVPSQSMLHLRISLM